MPPGGSLGSITAAVTCTAAAAAFKNLAQPVEEWPFATAALYWQARIAEKLGELKPPSNCYRQIVNGGDESYYQALSLRALGALGEPSTKPSQPNRRAASEADPPIGAGN